MTDRVHVTVDLQLFVDDAHALKEAAFDRMKSAWSSEDKFPFESAPDVPLDQAIQSLLADALPLSIAGAHRSQLAVETGDLETGESEDTESEDTESEDIQSGDTEGRHDDGSADEAADESADSDEPADADADAEEGRAETDA
jgi:hypothetical protein